MPNLRFRSATPAASATHVAPVASAAHAAPADGRTGGTGAESVTVEDLHKSFGGVDVLSGAGLSLAPGRIVALLGPSGCGKTTMLRCMAGLERPDFGTIRVGERTLFAPGVDVPAEHRRIGMVFQDWALFPHMTVAANVGYGLRRRREREGAVEAALRLVDLAGCAGRMPTTLSGGQQQRVALARALATRPSVLLLDEPFSNLDASLRGSIRGDVRALLTELGITALFVTHDQEEAFVVGDEVAVMLGGRVVQQSLPAELYTGPLTREVAQFIGDANLLEGTAEGFVALTSLGSVPLRRAASGPVEVLVRPEQLSVDTGDTAVVDRLEYYGHDAVYHVRADHGALVRVRVIDTPRHRPGDRVDIQFHGDPTTSFSPE
jgi:iron(III) transport system ATP-binding protein